jgi:hypothetical protein
MLYYYFTSVNSQILYFFNLLKNYAKEERMHETCPKDVFLMLILMRLALARQKCKKETEIGPGTHCFSGD